MNIDQRLRERAREINKDADRYQQLSRALTWLEKTDGIDIFPHFKGTCGSRASGYDDVIALLDEHVSKKMDEVILKIRTAAEAELKELEKKYG